MKPRKAAAIKREYLNLCELNILADKLEDPKSRELALIAYMGEDSNRPIPGADQAKLVYPKTPESSPLRRLLVDSYGDRLQEVWTPEATADIPKKFFEELCNKLLMQRPLSTGETVENCNPAKYHCARSGKKRKRVETKGDPERTGKKQNVRNQRVIPRAKILRKVFTRCLRT